jgi:hypothetical protein
LLAGCEQVAAPELLLLEDPPLEPPLPLAPELLFAPELLLASEPLLAPEPLLALLVCSPLLLALLPPDPELDPLPVAVASSPLSPAGLFGSPLYGSPRGEPPVAHAGTTVALAPRTSSFRRPNADRSRVPPPVGSLSSDIGPLRSPSGF